MFLFNTISIIFYEVKRKSVFDIILAKLNDLIFLTNSVIMNVKSLDFSCTAMLKNIHIIPNVKGLYNIQIYTYVVWEYINVNFHTLKPLQSPFLILKSDSQVVAWWARVFFYAHSIIIKHLHKFRQKLKFCNFFRLLFFSLAQKWFYGVWKGEKL